MLEFFRAHFRHFFKNHKRTERCNNIRTILVKKPDVSEKIKEFMISKNEKLVDDFEIFRKFLVDVVTHP